MNSDATCQTCEYWESISEMIIEGGWGKCKMTESEGTVPSAKMPTSKAIAVDGESYWAELRTRPTFGCNQHEPKETETAKENH